MVILTILMKYVEFFEKILFKSYGDIFADHLVLLRFLLMKSRCTCTKETEKANFQLEQYVRPAIRLVTRLTHDWLRTC